MRFGVIWCRFVARLFESKNLKSDPRNYTNRHEEKMCKKKRVTKDRLDKVLTCHSSWTSGGDDRIRTCEGLLTLNGLANRRLQPLGHISAAEFHSSRQPQIVKVSSR